MQLGLCQLCGVEKNLCDSHALPDSAFRSLFRNSNGKAVAFVDDSTTPTSYSSDSWSEPLLCEMCEADLNNRYDSYGIAVLQGRANRVTVSRGDAGVTFSGIDRQRFRMFVLSVIWRMAVSPNKSYGFVDIPYDLEKEIRDSLRNNLRVRPYVAEVGICRLRESTGIQSLSMENLRRILISPLPRNYGDFQSIFFLLFGFVIEVFFPRPPKKIVRGVGMVSGTNKVLFAPYQEVRQFPELLDLLVAALDKHEKGLTKVTPS